MTCLLESVAHIADDVLREQSYPFAKEQASYDEQQFLHAIETQDEQAAVAMIRGGLAEGLSFADFERGLAHAALAHYNDFGHSLIYIDKARRLINRLGESVAPQILVSLVRSMVYATREDLIPEFRGYAKALQRWGSGDAEPAPEAQAWFGLGIDRALDRTVQHSNADPLVLCHALLSAGAGQLLHFDARQQDKIRVPVSGNVGWLDFTHAITFAHAAIELCPRYPELWPPTLLQLTCFIGRNKSFTDAQMAAAEWQVDDIDRFLRESVEALFDHANPEFIISVHRLKTLLSARAILARKPPASLAHTVAAAVNRYLHSPLKRKQVQRTVHQAMAFVGRE